MNKVEIPLVFWHCIESYYTFAKKEQLGFFIGKSLTEYDFISKRGKLFSIEFDDDGSILVSLEKTGSWVEVDSLLNLVFSKEVRGETPTTVYWLENS